ncbi:MAG: hypothetical protein GY851_24225, partial [bacterium]|nr:hypothetical protein [bacterium]
FIDQGTDSLEIVVDWCRENDVEVFWSMRMNDVHDAWGAWYSPHLFPPIKQEHPEWLLGTKEKRPLNGGWTAVDFGHQEVRDLAFGFIEEVCQNYDVDGVQLDFFRHLNYFRNPSMGKPASEEELGMMTDLIRRVRTMADEVGAKRGRPILISVRVPDSVEFCKLVGFDVVRWMEDDLIDIMTVSGYFRLNPWETSVALAHEHNVPVWACISESRFKDADAKKVRASTECYRGRAANVWDSGADSVYMFNFFNPASPLWNELGEPATIAPLDKVFTTATRGYGSLSFWYEGGEGFMNRDIVEPGHPRTLEAGEAEAITLCVGEAIAPDRQVTLKLRYKTAPKSIAVTMNGEALADVSVSDTWMSCAVAAGIVKRGENAIVLSPSADAGEPQTLLDLQLWVRAKKE